LWLAENLPGAALFQPATLQSLGKVFPVLTSAA